MRIAAQARTFLKRLALGPIDYPQQCSVGLRDPQAEVTVRLHGMDAACDVTYNHLILLPRETAMPTAHGNSRQTLSAREAGRVPELASKTFAYFGYVIFIFVLALASLEVVSHITLAAYHHFRPHADVAADNPAYSRYPWGQELLQEQSLRVKEIMDTYVPFRMWGVTEWHGRFMNNDTTVMGTIRRTINPTNPACARQPKKNIWMFGGSTVYGTHLPDSDTLPSYLSSELNTKSACVEVTNLGVEGYVTNQELLLLIEQLKAGRRPDVVIFYDGFNDAYLQTVPPGDPTSHLGFKRIKRRLEGSMTGRFDFLKQSSTWLLAMELTSNLNRTHSSWNTNEKLTAQTVGVLNNYEANLRVARVLGDALGFTVYAFWQPALVYGKKPLVPYEEQLLERVSGVANGSYQALGPIYREAERRALKSGSFTFLGNIFEDVQKPLYLDSVHLNPVGNELAAQAMATYIREPLLEGGRTAGAPSQAPIIR